jgi:hypothetical protein
MDLTGAADLHCHFGPDAHRPRSVDALDAAREAKAAGHAAIVLKSHSEPTAQLAAIVGRVVDGIAVRGGVCCDREVGGVNPVAVETALRQGAAIVWLPTLSSQQDVDSGVAEQLGLPLHGLRVTTSDDPTCLTDEAADVLALVAGQGAILATGHVSAAEHVAVAQAFAGRGSLLVTHAMEELAGPNLGIDACVELAQLGATIELCALTCIGTLATRPVADLVACIRAVGVERVTLATDYGQAANPHPAEGLNLFAEALVAEGVSEADVRTMACANPCALLGLGDLSTLGA